MQGEELKTQQGTQPVIQRRVQELWPFCLRAMNNKERAWAPPVVNDLSGIIAATRWDVNTG